MEWFFGNAINQSGLLAALKRWEGTPFIQGQSAPGVGVDCIHFVREVYRDCGVDVSAANIPRYSLAWGIHQSQSQIIDWLLAEPAARRRFAVLDPLDDWLAGDLIAIQLSSAAHHVAIVSPDLNDLWHVVVPGGVTRAAAKVMRTHKLKALFRLRHELPCPQA